jgi:hypothetical protein
MAWIYRGKVVNELPNDCEAFVYVIENLLDNRKYIGKKIARFKKSRPPLKGKKNKRRSTVESNWRDYWGSNDHLKQDVERLGAENFTRTIIYFCPSRGVASYLEAAEQMKRRVLETDEYYNGIINVRIGSSDILKKTLTEMRNSGLLL